MTRHVQLYRILSKEVMHELQAINLSLGKIANQLKGASAIEQQKIAEEVTTNAQRSVALFNVPPKLPLFLFTDGVGLRKGEILFGGVAFPPGHRACSYSDLAVAQISLPLASYVL